MIKFAQTKYLKQDKSKNCEEYPTTKYTSYKQCDEEFVIETIKKNYPFMPMWAALDLKEVTNIRVYKEMTMPEITDVDLVDGTQASSCLPPCTSTTIQGAYINTEEYSSNWIDITFSQDVDINVFEYPPFNIGAIFSGLGGSMGLWLGLGVVQLLGAALAMCMKIWEH